MSLDPRDALRLALAPRSIAVIGASDNAHKIGGRPLAYLARFGFAGVALLHGDGGVLSSHVSLVLEAA